MLREQNSAIFQWLTSILLMISDNETGRALGIVDSMNTVVFDVDEELFRATYNSARDPTSLAVVAVIAAATDRDACELPPLHYTIDAGALDSLFSATISGGQRSGCLSFSYDGFEVTVCSEGIIEAVPPENTDVPS